MNTLFVICAIPTIGLAIIFSFISTGISVCFGIIGIGFIWGATLDKDLL
jgi:hypothetical protein